MKSEPIKLGIKCVVKIPGSCGAEFAFVLFQNTDNSNENAMEDALLINSGFTYFYFMSHWQLVE